MSTELDEALEWFDRADQAREVAGQLTDPGARQAVFPACGKFRAAGTRRPRPAPREEGGGHNRGPGQEPVICRARWN